MITTRFQNLIAGGLLAVSAALGAPSAAAEPDNPGDPGNPTGPDVPMAPNDVSCIAQPGIGACAGGPYGLHGGMPVVPGMPSMPGMDNTGGIRTP